MKFITPEEAGNILARLVIANERFGDYLLLAARNAEDRMLPDDVDDLIHWVNFMRILSSCLNELPLKK